jgi:hypothetical protein
VLEVRKKDKNKLGQDSQELGRRITRKRKKRPPIVYYYSLLGKTRKTKRVWCKEGNFEYLCKVRAWWFSKEPCYGNYL